MQQVCPKGGLDEARDKIVAAILDGAPQAQARGKKVILGIAGRAIDDEMIKFTVEQIAEARASDEGKEGLSAFLSKTEPRWRKKS